MAPTRDEPTKKRATTTLLTGRKPPCCRYCKQRTKGHSAALCSQIRNSVLQDQAAEGVQVGGPQAMPSGSGHLQPEAHQTEEPTVNDNQSATEHSHQFPPLSIQMVPVGQDPPASMSNPQYLEGFQGHVQGANMYGRGNYDPNALTAPMSNAEYFGRFEGHVQGDNMYGRGNYDPSAWTAPMSNPEYFGGFEGHVQGDNMYGRGNYDPNAYGAIAGPSNFAYGQDPMASSSYPSPQDLPLSNADHIASGDQSWSNPPYQVRDQVATNPIMPMGMEYNNPLIPPPYQVGDQVATNPIMHMGMDDGGPIMPMGMKYIDPIMPSGPGPSSMANYPQSAERQSIPVHMFNNTPAPASSPASDRPTLPLRPLDPMRRNLATGRNNAGAFMNGYRLP